MTGRYPQFRKYSGGKFKTRNEAHAMRRHIWICQSCHRWHDDGKPRTCDGCGGEAMWYMQSKRQAERAANLLFQRKMGYIRDLRFEVPFDVKINGKKVFTYRADAVYVKTATGETVTEDTKASANPKAHDPVFRLKKACVEAMYGIEIKIATGG